MAGSRYDCDQRDRRIAVKTPFRSREKCLQHRAAGTFSKCAGFTTQTWRCRAGVPSACTSCLGYFMIATRTFSPCCQLLRLFLMPYRLAVNRRRPSGVLPVQSVLLLGIRDSASSSTRCNSCACKSMQRSCTMETKICCGTRQTITHDPPQHRPRFAGSIPPGHPKRTPCSLHVTSRKHIHLHTTAHKDKLARRHGYSLWSAWQRSPSTSPPASLPRVQQGIVREHHSRRWGDHGHSGRILCTLCRVPPDLTVIQCRLK